jgi:CheY-like chemotaxis protein
MSRATRILIADTPEGVQAFRQALSTTLPLQAATSLEQARQAVQEPPAVVVCGCHFDEDKMYDLLRHLKASPPLDKVPFVAVRCVEGEMALDGALYESVKIAVRALGGNAFVDLLRWQRRYGEAEANHRLTRLVETLAQAPQPDTT